jgi:ankyrin repeat protein
MKIITKEFEEELKNAIVNEDVKFLDNHKNDYDLNLKFESEDNDSLIDYAISYKESNIYKYLLERNVSLDNINDKGENIIHSIVYSGCANRLIEVYNIKKINLNHKSNDGTTPLILSVLLENFEIFKLLIELGANINLSDEDGNLPIHLACQFGHIEMVDILLEQGTKLFDKTENGNLPLALAVNENHIKIIKKLYDVMYKF